MMKNFFAIAVVIVSACLLATKTHADVVTLKTGETLVGTVVSQNDPQVVVLRHQVLGELRIPASDVASTTLVSDSIPAAKQVETAEVEAIKAQVRQEVIEEVRAEVEKEIAEAKAAAEAAAKAEEEKAAYAGLPPELRSFFMILREWNVELEFGFAGSQGNTEELSFRIAGKAQKETATDRWTLNAYYYHLQSDGETSNDEGSFSVLKDWLFEDSPWLIWATGYYNYNNFTDWRNRVGGFAGVGYAFFQGDELELIGRVGLGYTYNFSGARRNRPEAYFGLDLIRWKPLPGHLMVGKIGWIPDLLDIPENRAEASVEYSIEIPQVEGMSFKVGMSNEYESITSDDSKHNDFTWFSSLVYKF